MICYQMLSGMILTTIDYINNCPNCAEHGKVLVLVGSLVSHTVPVETGSLLQSYYNDAGIRNVAMWDTAGNAVQSPCIDEPTNR